MTASVGCSMVGSARCSTRTSPGAYNSAPRMGGSSFRLGDRVSVAAEDLFGDGHRGHRFRPAGVEGQVRDHLDEFLLGGAFCLARPRWNTSCSVLPPVVSAATVTRLRSLGESCGRVHACPNSTSSVKCTSAGAEVAFPVMVWSFLMSETSGAGRDPQRRG